MINFQEHVQTGYAMRTLDNARLSDLTIAFAIDFNTPGEILTRKAAYGKYLAVNMLYSIDEAVESCIKEIDRRKATRLNIAGNGIYTLYKDGLVSQEQANEYIEAVLLLICSIKDKRFIIRSGGQTGADTAGLLAGDKLGLETICLAPKHYMFRDINGRDIIGHEALFLKRFGEKYDVTDIL